MGSKIGRVTASDRIKIPAATEGTTKTMTKYPRDKLSNDDTLSNCKGPNFHSKRVSQSNKAIGSILLQMKQGLVRNIFPAESLSGTLSNKNRNCNFNNRV